MDGITAARRRQIVVNADAHESCQISTEMNNHHNPSFSITFICLIASRNACQRCPPGPHASSIVGTSADLSSAWARWAMAEKIWRSVDGLLPSRILSFFLINLLHSPVIISNPCVSSEATSIVFPTVFSIIQRGALVESAIRQ